MGRKCKVFGCKTGYDSEVKRGESKRSFPENPDECHCQSWISAISNKDLSITSIMSITKNYGV